MINACAFCGHERPLTKEHVWPSGFMDRVGRSAAHYSPKSGRVHGGDYVVRDVCAECNNVYLAKLDEYFCALYDRHLSIALGANETATLDYNYNLLCRVLLKISYNTARSSGSDAAPFQRLLPYLLRGGDCPPGVALIAELVSPTFIADRMGFGTVQEVRPVNVYRSALGQLLTPHGNAILVRVVAVNSFFFYLLLARNADDLQSFDLARDEFLTGLSGTVALVPNGGEVTLRSSQRDSLSSMLPLLSAKRDQYRDFFKRKKEGSDNKGSGGIF